MFEVIKIVVFFGVDVRVMIFNKFDYVFVYCVIINYVGELMEMGVKIFIYDNGFIYVKIFVVDGEIVLVGIVNMDFWSFWFNFEVNVFIYEK